MMAGMNLNASKGIPREGRARKVDISTARHGKGYSKVGGFGLKLSEGRIKSRKASRVKDKIKTLPASVTLNREFWKTVM